MSFVRIVVIMPSKGNKILVDKLFKPHELALDDSLHSFFLGTVRLLAREEMGSLFKCTIVFGDSTSETEVSSLNDDLFDYVQMEPKKFFFYVDGVACENMAAPPPLAEVLQWQPLREVPTTTTGRPAIDAVFKQLRELLVRDKLGFVSSSGARLGCEWMLKLAHVLYNMSTFHDNFRARGFAVPSRFSFSKGANNYQKKKQSAPKLTQAVVETVCASPQPQ